MWDTQAATLCSHCGPIIRPPRSELLGGLDEVQALRGQLSRAVCWEVQGLVPFQDLATSAHRVIGVEGGVPHQALKQIYPQTPPVRLLAN